MKKLQALFELGLYISATVIAVFAVIGRVIDLVSYSEFKTIMLVAAVLFLAGFVINKQALPNKHSKSTDN